MDPLIRFIPIDRLRALAQGQSLPDRATGTALLADLSGFTALTEAFATLLGPQYGAEALTRALTPVYDALIGATHRYGGTVLSFAGDAITCWFDDIPPLDSWAGVAPAAQRAATSALAMQAAMAAFAAMPLPNGTAVPLGLKVGLTAGPARRFLVGNPEIQWIDALAGAPLERLGVAEELAARGEVVLDAVAVAALAAAGPRGTPRPAPADGTPFFALTDLATPAAESPWPPLDFELTAEAVRPWLLPAVRARLEQGQGEFLTELRPVAALFLRFAGLDYTHPAAGARLDTYIRWVQRVLACYEAALLQLTIGDKGSYLYAAFGAPVAHDDDVTRAVAAALELRTPPPEYEFIRGIQIGLSRGLVRAGAYGGATRQTYGALGDTVNLAARLMQHAPVGGILGTGDMRSSAGPRFRWASLPPLRVKGKAAPITVCGLVGDYPAQRGGLLEPASAQPLVGRASELAALAAVRAAALAGQGQVVGVTGEAGLGKSRLVAEEVHRAQAAGWVVYGGAAQSYGTNTAYLAWQPIWQAFFDLDATAPSEVLRRDLESALEELDPVMGERLPLLGPVLGARFPDTSLTAALDPALRKASLEALLVACLRIRYGAHPTAPLSDAGKGAAPPAGLMLVLEDCHWLDPLSHDLLEAIGRACGSMRVLLLVAYRPLESTRLAAPHVAYSTELRLTHFTPDEAAALVAAHLSVFGDDLLPTDSPPPPELVAQLVARAEGNPFYLEELLNYLAEQGIDPRDPAALTQLAWPSSLQSLLLARIDQLTEQQRTVLKVASIIGRLFHESQLWGVYPNLGPQAPVEAALEVLDQHDLTPLDSPEADPAYLFKHLVTQEVTYGSLPQGFRAQLHEQFATWIEAGHMTSTTPPLDLLAYHYGQSTNTTKQREYYRKAGDAAAAAYAHGAAVEYYEQLLGILPRDGAGSRRDQAAVRIALGEVLERSGAWDAATARYEEILDPAFGTVDADLQAAAVLGLGVVRRDQGAYVEAESWLEQARVGFAALGEAPGASTGVSRALAELGKVYQFQGDYARARAVLEDSLALWRVLGDPAGISLALHTLGWAAWRLGDYGAARAAWEESLALRRARADKWGIAWSLTSLGALGLVQHDLATAEARFDESLALCRTIGDRQGAAIALNNLALVHLEQEDLAAAQALLAESLALYRELGDKRSIATSLNNLAELATTQGDPAGAQELLTESLSLAREVGDKGGITLALQSLGMTALALGDLLAAQARWAEGLALCLELGDKHHTANGLVGLAGTALAAAPGAAGATRATCLLGTAARLLADLGTALPALERRLYEQTEAAARAALPADAFAAALAAGAALAWADAVAEALSMLSIE